MPTFRSVVNSLLGRDPQANLHQHHNTGPKSNINVFPPFQFGIEFETYQMPPDSTHTEEGWIDPIVIPSRSTHTQSFILLHGRGGNAREFSCGLLLMPLAGSSLTLPELFPEAAFVFPTSKVRRVARAPGIRSTQWFDLSSIISSDEQQDLQYEGLRESAKFIHKIIAREAGCVGMENVVLGGLSQGCAVGLHTLMSFEEGGLAGFFGLSGWMPFARQLKFISEGKGPEGIDQGLVGKDEGDGKSEMAVNCGLENSERLHLSTRAIRFVRHDVMEMPFKKGAGDTTKVPVYLGHGELDHKVPIDLGRDAAETMRTLGWAVEWKQYSGLAHWYSRQELADVADWLQRIGVRSQTSDHQAAPT